MLWFWKICQEALNVVVIINLPKCCLCNSPEMVIGCLVADGCGEGDVNGKSWGVLKSEVAHDPLLLLLCDPDDDDVSEHKLCGSLIGVDLLMKFINGYDLQYKIFPNHLNS